jgi:hypothetical protein
MIAQALLTVLLAGIVLYAWREYRRSPVISVASTLVSGIGLYLVWIPSHATRLAEWAGVGRGVDLVIYVWVVISLLVILNLHLKLRAQMELITKLARSMAVDNALRASRGSQE